MLLLIDGYNLLYQSDVMGRGRGEGWLQRARERLLRQLQRHLDAVLAAETCVVFDAESPPLDRPHEYWQSGIRILYAVGYPEADDLVEELIAQHPAPQRLTVISSDRRLQRAARRRRAQAFDAEPWYDQLIESGPRLAIGWPPAGSAVDEPPLPIPQKRHGLESDREVEAWLAWFQQGASERDRLPPGAAEPDPIPPSSQGPQPPAAPNLSPPAGGSKRPPVPRRASKDQRLGAPDKQIDGADENPFPEGYGEDLLDEPDP